MIGLGFILIVSLPAILMLVFLGKLFSHTFSSSTPAPPGYHYEHDNATNGTKTVRDSDPA